MAITKSWGVEFSSTALQPLEVKVLDRDTFVPTSEKPMDVELRQTSSTLSQPYRLRMAAEKVSNVYKNTDIDPAYFAVNKSGVQVLAQTKAILRVTCTDSDGCSKTADIPFEGHIVVRVPNTELVSEDDINQFTEQMIGAIYTGPTTGSSNPASGNAIYQMACGILKPEDWTAPSVG